MAMFEEVVPLTAPPSPETLPNQPVDGFVEPRVKFVRRHGSLRVVAYEFSFYDSDAAKLGTWTISGEGKPRRSSAADRLGLAIRDAAAQFVSDLDEVPEFRALAGLKSRGIPEDRANDETRKR